MLRAAIVFFILGLVAMALGASGFAGLTVEIGRMLLGIFLVLSLVSVVAALLSGGGGKTLPRP